MDRLLRILIAGDWQWRQYEPAFSDALRAAGHEVLQYAMASHFRGVIGKVQQALPILPSPALRRLNRELLGLLRDQRPDVLLTWRCTHVLPSLIEKANEMGIVTVSYNNDDAFNASPSISWRRRRYWHRYLQCLRHCHANMVYRPVNTMEAKAHGARNVHVLKPYFIPDYDRPLELSAEERLRFECDVVFVGHYEADGREGYLQALVDAGVHVRIFGGKYWTPEVLGRHASYFGEVSLANGEDYTRALCGAKICLAFLSKTNRDVYTRRCFEIPACGRLLLCERTAAMMEMFVDGEEAVFFSDRDELVKKVLWLLSHPEEIEAIADSGMKRVWADGHDVSSRAREFVGILQEDRLV